jgi:hypothetical protein
LIFLLIGFSSYIDNPLRDLLCAQILRSNVDRVKNVDDMIRSLIRTRYTNLGEYKLKIIYSSNLPTYIKYILSDNGFWSPNNHGIISANSLRTHVLNTITVFEHHESNSNSQRDNHTNTEKKENNNSNSSIDKNSNQIALMLEGLANLTASANASDLDQEAVSKRPIITNETGKDVDTSMLVVEYDIKQRQIQSKVIQSLFLKFIRLFGVFF